VTTTDHDALRACCLADPEDRTVRLVYADEVQRLGEDDRAELIRVRVEWEQLDGSRKTGHGFPSADRDRMGELNTRIAELLASNPQWTRAGCPECEGSGLYHPAGFGTCLVCSGTGDLFHGLAVDFDGISLTVTAPTMQTWVGRECRACSSRGVGVWCECGEPLWDAPTPRLRAVAKVPLVEFVLAADREPEAWFYNGRTTYSWFVCGLTGDAATIPEPVFDRLTGWCDVGDGRKMFPTRAAAVRAFGRGMKEFGLGVSTSEAPSGPTPPAAVRSPPPSRRRASRPGPPGR
jgi:uncharacterized protein (TIGR02996 family)